MATDTFTTIELTALPTKGAAGISAENKANAEAVAAIIVLGQAAQSGRTFDTPRKAYDAGQNIARHIKSLALNTVSPVNPDGKVTVRTIPMGKDKFGFALAPLAPKADA